MTNANDLDVLIIGAGIGGVGAACHLKMNAPEKRFAIWERRTDIGGTWDLFRYPGIRSDSDMYTLGYNFKPWMKHKVLADGPAIKAYLKETVDEYNVLDTITFGRRITSVEWDSRDARWTVTATDETTGETHQVRAQHVLMCTGYYDYDNPYTPDYAGSEEFEGQIIHPQHWPEDLDYTNKKVVVIGSGATAVTLVPAMAEKTAHITMLQRSPTYYASVKNEDRMSKILTKLMPRRWAFKIIRAFRIWMQDFAYTKAQAEPDKWREKLQDATKEALEGKVDMKHFTPRYNPWDQRLCAVPEDDLFVSLREGKASIVTDEIDHFDKTGIQLKSGEHLDADIIVSATGLNLKMLGGVDLVVDGKHIPHNSVMAYKTLMLENIPNLAFILGYVNASWTLKVGIAMDYYINLMKLLDERGLDMAVPRAQDPSIVQESSVWDALNSGYVNRARHNLPRQGSVQPWRVDHDFRADRRMLRGEPVDDGTLQFARAGANAPENLAAE